MRWLKTAADCRPNGGAGGGGGDGELEDEWLVDSRGFRVRSCGVAPYCVVRHGACVTRAVRWVQVEQPPKIIWNNIEYKL